MKKTTRLIFTAVFFVATAITLTACGGESFTDPRDGQTYKMVKIGDQVWMAENLRYKTPQSICFLEDEKQCSKGRFYSVSEIDEICPTGWHLPTLREAEKLTNNLNMSRKSKNYFETLIDEFTGNDIETFFKERMGYYHPNTVPSFVNAFPENSSDAYLLLYSFHWRLRASYYKVHLEKDSFPFGWKGNVRCILGPENKE